MPSGATSSAASAPRVVAFLQSGSTTRRDRRCLSGYASCRNTIRPDKKGCSARSPATSPLTSRPGGALVELGSGGERQDPAVARRGPHLSAYVPVDISQTALQAAAAAIARDYPSLRVVPVRADFTRSWGGVPDEGPLAAFFPGSTIGNFTPDEAVHLMVGVRERLGADGLFIVGIDLAKDEADLLVRLQ